MSATNSTPNYGLPQYVADDKPTYLGDFNKAMLDIDTNMKTIDNKAVSAQGSVSTANSNASQALETAQNAQTIAETAQATATTAKSTADTAKSTAEQANTNSNQANNNINSLSNDIDNWISSDIKPTSDAGVKFSMMNYNKKLKLLSLFGDAYFSENPVATKIVGTLPENIRPKNDIIVYAGCDLQFVGAGWQTRAFKINTQGQIIMPDEQASINIETARWNVMLYLSDDRWNIQ